MRALVASSIGGPHARALVMPLVALTAERDRTAGAGGVLPGAGAHRVAGGGAGAGQGGAGCGEPAAPASGGDCASPPSKALQHAGGAMARRTLEALTKDGDKAVRAAALKAVAAAPK